MEELDAFIEVSMRLSHLIQSQSKELHSQSMELKFLRIRVEELESERNEYLQRCFRQ